MKIVFLIDQMYLHGGIERVLSIKANYLVDQPNYTIHIITTEQKNNPYCYQLSPKIKIKDIGINYERTRSYFHPTNLKKLPNHISKLKKELKTIKPNVVVVCSHSTDTYFVPFIKKQIPKVKEFHFSKSIEQVFRTKNSKSKKKYFLKFADYVESKYDKLVVLNPDEATYYKSKNTIIIPNPLTFFPKKKADLTNKTVIAAGRIAPVKQYDHLIDCWKIIHEQNKDWKLEIYGTGDEYLIEELKNKIDELKLSEVVSLKGGSNNIQEKMLSASLLVMSSKNECFPLVLLEAQACGLPIVSYNSPHGPKNIVTKESGYIVEKNNKIALANKVLELISDPEKRQLMGMNSKLNAKNYTLETVMKKWAIMFTKLTEKIN